MDYYSARKRNKGLVCETIWMDPKGIMLSEKKRNINIRDFLKDKITELENRLVVARG